MTATQRWLIRLFYLLIIGYSVIAIHGSFTFIALNSFLAYIPIEMSFWLDHRRLTGVLFWPLTIIWMLFYPNAPYMITDLLHLSLLSPYGADGLMRLDLSLWMQFCELVAPVFVSTILGTWGLSQVATQIQQRLRLARVPGSHLTVVGILTLISAVGIYVGRFLRFHSIYFLMDPKYITKQLIAMWTPKMIIFVVFLWFLQMLIYWGWKFTTNHPVTKDSAE